MWEAASAGAYGGGAPNDVAGGRWYSARRYGIE